jgi:hypothetical protein
MKQVVIVSRKWHHPKISMIVTDEEISFFMDLTDFRDALKRELSLSNGNAAKIDEAFEKVIYGIKTESPKVIA